MSTVRYAVPGISCGHCAAAITGEVSTVPGVTSVDVSVDDKIVTVAGEAEQAAVEAAIEEAGYEVSSVTAG